MIRIRSAFHRCFLLGFCLCTYMPRGMYLHAERLLAKAGVARRKGRGISHPWSGGEAGAERTKHSEGLHKRSAEDWGNPLRRAIGAEPLSVLSTCVTKQTKDMVYSAARRLWFLSSEQFRTILNALEREPDHGSTSAVFGQLSGGRDVGSEPVPRVGIQQRAPSRRA